MDNDNPSLDRLKHKPVFLLPYDLCREQGSTTCRLLSLGWAQYDRHSASLKVLRHSGSKWSRQSEEVPLDRVVDLTILLAGAIGAMKGPHLDNIQFPANTFEHQPRRVTVQAGAVSSLEEGEAFGREITKEVILRRLGKLREVLNELHDAGTI